MSDKQLLLQLQDHSQDALELLMQKYSPYLYTVITYILGRVGSPEDIEELMQDSFYAVWNHAENIHGNLKAYIRTTARNKAASWLRSHRELPMAFDYIEIPVILWKMSSCRRNYLNTYSMHCVECIPRIERFSSDTIITYRTPLRYLNVWGFLLAQ